MNSGTISSDIQNDLTKFINSIDLSEVNLNDFMLYLFTGITSTNSVIHRFSIFNHQLHDFPVIASMGINGQGNLVALASSIYLHSASGSVSESTLQMLSVLMLLLLKEGLTEKTMQILIDSDSWDASTTAILTVSFQDCVYHYFALLLQHQLQSVSELAGGCMSSSPLSPVFSVIRGFIENEYPIPNNDVLHYAFYYMAPDEYLKLVIYFQDSFNPMSILTKRMNRSVYQTQRNVLQSKSNYIHLLNYGSQRCLISCFQMNCSCEGSRVFGHPATFGPH